MLHKISDIMVKKCMRWSKMSKEKQNTEQTTTAI